MHENKVDKSLNLQKPRFEIEGAKLLNIQVQDCLCHLQTTKRSTERVVFYTFVRIRLTQCCLFNL